MTMIWTVGMALAAAFNLVIGAFGLVRKGATSEGRLTAVLVAAFGVVYALVASDVPRFAPMLWAGVAGKLGAIAVMLSVAARGEGPKTLRWVLMGDALFTGFFLVILLQTGWLA